MELETWGFNQKSSGIIIYPPFHYCTNQMEKQQRICKYFSTPRGYKNSLAGVKQIPSDTEMATFIRDGIIFGNALQ